MEFPTSPANHQDLGRTWNHALSMSGAFAHCSTAPKQRLEAPPYLICATFYGAHILHTDEKCVCSPGTGGRLWPGGCGNTAIQKSIPHSYTMYRRWKYSLQSSPSFRQAARRLLNMRLKPSSFPRPYVCPSCQSRVFSKRRKFASIASKGPDIYDVVCVGGGPVGLGLVAALSMLRVWTDARTI